MGGNKSHNSGNSKHLQVILSVKSLIYGILYFGDKGCIPFFLDGPLSPLPIHLKPKGRFGEDFFVDDINPKNY